MVEKDKRVGSPRVTRYTRGQFFRFSALVAAGLAMKACGGDGGSQEVNTTAPTTTESEAACGNLVCEEDRAGEDKSGCSVDCGDNTPTP